MDVFSTELGIQLSFVKIEEFYFTESFKKGTSSPSPLTLNFNPSFHVIQMPWPNSDFVA